MNFSNSFYPAAVLVFISICFGTSLAKKAGDCEVCVKFLERFIEQLPDDKRKSIEKIEDNFRKFCKNNARGKDERFCYYIGGSETSATGLLNSMSKPVSYYMPAEKICEKLNSKDSQICELKYDKTIDLSEVNFKKLKVKDLKKILSDWNDQCKGCTEKSDFISRIEELMPKFDPESHKKRLAKQEL
ncbi:unnamed protein product [Owenia fusiformis]|uniref:Mesencephalic astrocyte-derived neurotrophic factor homolog n=1 Tax=Owenia fusiformis TaxID=6347 RepID=A0A8J1XF09_OWEFU|nr:unnamed protein product [Owenia fusiformis]